jgi:CRP/FNR family transcriptional regulator, anaerobic regulatory protein
MMISEASIQRLAILYPVLKELPVSLIRTIQETSYELIAPAGQILFDLGADCEYVPLLKSGSIRVIKPFRTGSELLLYRVLPGQLCILTVTCLLSSWKQLARVAVEQDLKAVSIPKESFSRLIEASSGFREFVFSNYSISLFSLLNCVEITLTQPVEQRVAKVLLDKGTDLIEVTHQGLANEVGTAREVVSRILKEFEKKGIVKLKRGIIFIQDREALVQTLQAACD